MIVRPDPATLPDNIMTDILRLNTETKLPQEHIKKQMTKHELETCAFDSLRAFGKHHYTLSVGAIMLRFTNAVMELNDKIQQ